jgi:hypothetical protein
MYVNLVAFEHALWRVERDFVTMGVGKILDMYEKLPLKS